MIKLVLVRHGESVWNLENKFTGWTDVELSSNGIQEAHDAGSLLRCNGYSFDMCFTSVLKRANDTLDIILEEMGVSLPINYSYKLNERHYGALQGLNKKETALKYGDEQVKLWRRSADVRPPELSIDDKRHPIHDSKYKDIDKSLLPSTENLNDTIVRVSEYYNSDIKKELLNKKNVLIVAHGNSLRGLIKYLDNLSDEEVISLEIATGKPICYEFDDDLNVIRHYYIKERSKVYFTRNVDSESVLKMYKILNKELPGKVCAKVHSGEEGNNNYLKPEFWKSIIDYLDATVVECNTAYDGERDNTVKHLKTIRRHGWNDLYNFDLMDMAGPDMELDIPKGKVLKKNLVGSHMKNYDSMLVLSHFKGHVCGGYGGALKQLSIGCASKTGKCLIHSAGVIDNESELWDYVDMSEFKEKHIAFLDSMADAASSVVNYFKGNMAFINVMANLSVDCDCSATAEKPCMKDIGILSSLDPVSLDKACMDLIYSSSDPGRDHFIERVESRHGNHTIDAACELDIGSEDYELIEI